jgi:hypothetical protein
MQPLQIGVACAACLEFIAQPVLHGFDVVIGARFDGLDGGDIRGGRILCHGCQKLPCRRRQFGERHVCGAFRQRQRPRAFHSHAFAHQSGFAEQVTNLRETAGITAVEGREGIAERGGHRRASLGW